MGLYWRRSTKILPGVRINWSKMDQAYQWDLKEQR